MKLNFMDYSGGDPVGWLNKCEQYFEFYQIPEKRKLVIASMHLCGKASDRWYMFNHEFPHSWQGLADLLMMEFSCYNRTDYQAAVGGVSQLGSVEEYMELFTKLSRRALGFSPGTLTTFFIGGLKEEIQAHVTTKKNSISHPKLPRLKFAVVIGPFFTTAKHP
ncbi:hypothetical protein ACLB2K_007382 [Fragaria x ananassa]